MPDDKPLDFVLSDGLGRMDIAKNLQKGLELEEAMFSNAVVQAAVQTLRKIGTQLGDLIIVEIVIRVQLQKRDLGDVDIVALSC